ncbi:DUF4439 domain-containing protein [Corynebacterium pacaense]|uniref:DUF4439 domain-containing protein n=1 Tax=Corynebacterium pacaense TaxID=1816684 RepID=UPI001178AE90|nr:DUF4439 domain-containing protein [Corynebacterium pacaense]
MHVERRLPPLAALILGGTLLLSACTPAPKANDSLVAAVGQARFDAQALRESAPEVAELRDGHAEELRSEIDRLCGFAEDNRVPESCAVSLPETTASPSFDVQATVSQGQAEILDIISEVPVESVPLLAQQYVELARFDARAAAPRVPADLTMDSGADRSTATDLLDRENESAWMLGVALAYADPSASGAITDAISAHQLRAEQLTGLLAPFGVSGSPAAGYSLSGYPEPVDAGSASELFEVIQRDTAQAWLRAATVAENDRWRVFATEVAGDASGETPGRR